MGKLLSVHNVYFPAIINAYIFFIISITLFLIKPESLLLLLLPTLIFCIGSFLSFLYLIKSLRVLEPLTWYVCGSGLFFGLGVIAGGLNSHEWTRIIFGESNEHLINVNLLNSSSVLIVLTVGILVLRVGTLQSYKEPLKQEKLPRQKSIIIHVVFDKSHTSSF